MEDKDSIYFVMYSKKLKVQNYLAMFITSTMSVTENDLQPVQTGQTLLRGNRIPRDGEA